MTCTDLPQASNFRELSQFIKDPNISKQNDVWDSHIVFCKFQPWQYFSKKCPIKVGINKYNINSQYEDRTESEKENIRKGDFSR